MQPRKYTTYDRDANGRDQAMMRSYHGWFSRFDQPDPFDGSYDLADTQSLNRYSYVGNDPVNFIDPTGLTGEPICDGSGRCYPWQPPLATIYGYTGSGGTPPIGTGFPAHDLGIDAIGVSDSGSAVLGVLEPEPTTQGLVNPCPGVSGSDLRYDEWRNWPYGDGSHTARWHITNRHINQLPQYVGRASQYLFAPPVYASPDPTGAKQAAVGALNAFTFNNAVGVPQSNGHVKYTFDFDVFNHITPYQPMIAPHLIVGIDNSPSGGGRETTLNTLLVARDCQTVVTSYPGQ